MLQGVVMADLIFIALSVASFALIAGYIAALGKV